MKPSYDELEDWRRPPAELNLDEDELHVWRASLERDERTVAKLHETLSPDEMERAFRFYFRRDRDHYVVARGILRNVLSRYLSSAPEEIRFEYDAFGKPSLAEGKRELGFNLSHSKGVALYAVALKCELGVDVEFMKEEFATEDVANGFFAAEEVAAIQKLEPALRTRAFFKCWTRKEAYIKAIGEGLSHPLDQFAVTVVPGEPARLLKERNETAEVSRWRLVDLNPGEGFAAALSFSGGERRISLWEWFD